MAECLSGSHTPGPRKPTAGPKSQRRLSRLPLRSREIARHITPIWVLPRQINLDKTPPALGLHAVGIMCSATILPPGAHLFAWRLAARGPGGDFLPQAPLTGDLGGPTRRLL